MRGQMTVDPRAQSGFAHSVDAYEQGRPSYPPEAVAKAARELGVGPASTVLDLGAGTGKLTRLLLPLAGRVVAVEPSPPMLAKLREQLPGVEARGGTAEVIPLPDAEVDAVLVGEAFHWFRTEEACREIARVLVPAGGLAMLWNRSRWSEGDLPWLREFNGLVKPYRAAAGEFPAGHETWKTTLDASRLFEPLSSATFEYVQRLDPAGFLALVASWSWIANLSEPTRASVLTRVRELVDGASELRLRYQTEVHWTRRRRKDR
jgi:SAM-dependent methyltransferase